MAFLPTSFEATVNAVPEYTRKYSWTIDKTVNPSSIDLFSGDSATFNYTIAVTKAGYVDSAKITGQVCVTNTGLNPTDGLTITVALERRLPGQTSFTTIVQPKSVSTSAAPILYPAPGNPPLEPNSFCYDYSIEIENGDINTSATYRVVASVDIVNHPGNDEPKTPKYTFALPPYPTPVHGTITITDTNGNVYPSITDTTTFTYPKTFDCSTTTHTNTATITYEDDNTTGPSDSATITINCYSLNVRKSANTRYIRTYDWTIDKKISEDGTAFDDTANFTLAFNETHAAYYRVIVTPTSTDHDFEVIGIINIHNLAPIAATINSITDVISPIGISASVDFGPITFPYDLPGGMYLDGSYSAAVPNFDIGSVFDNTATVTLQNYNYSFNENNEMVRTKTGTTDFHGPAIIMHSPDPYIVQNQCVSVSDDLTPGIHQANALDPSTQTINYTGAVGPYPTCGNYTVTNTATFTAVPCYYSTATGATGSNSAIAKISVPCSGCTHTIGFWKTHAGFTGNNPDRVTPLLPQWLGTEGGIKSVKVETAAQAVRFLDFYGDTNPPVRDASNGINKLYAQLLAAKLNIAYGANGSVVSSTISAADSFLAKYDSYSWATLGKSLRNYANDLATTLDQYNNGFKGVPHCSESGEPIEPGSPEDETDQVTTGGITINITIKDCSNFGIAIVSDKDSNSQQS